MPSSPNKLSQFWQELKRRNVVRVVTVYAGAAFVIIELINNITEPLKLPEWTPTLVIVLLAIGFPVVFIFSWIYDVRPEGGVVKTEPVDKVKAEDVPKSSNGWRIASFISFVVIVGLIVLNIVPRTGKKEILDKSIAVLPFKNDSPNQERMYFINGTMEAILDNLCKIEDLRVPGRTSMEQYRNNPKPIPVVADEMNVSYVLEGSGHRDGNNVRLTVQLLEGKTDRHIWSKSYDSDIEEIFSMQSEIAQLVASEIEAIITPKEKELIENVPTPDLTAYDFYLKGNEEFGNGNYDRAEELFNEALRLDPTYAEAYADLGALYYVRTVEQDYFSDRYLDTAMIFVDIALSHNDELSEAYMLQAIIFQMTGRSNEALSAFEKVVEFNPNEGWVHSTIGDYYSETDYVKCINSIQKALSLNTEFDRSYEIRRLGATYFNAGFWDIAFEYYGKLIRLEGDSTSYYGLQADYEFFILGNFELALKYYKKALDRDTTHSRLYSLGWVSYKTGDYKKSLDYMRLSLELAQKDQLEQFFFQNRYQRIALAYLANGFREEAEHYFNLLEESQLAAIELGREQAQNYYAYYDLAGLYAFKGEYEKALENLRIFNEKEVFSAWMVGLIKMDVLFDSIRDKPEFQQIVRDVEAKYQAEHERVRQWLEANDML